MASTTFRAARTIAADDIPVIDISPLATHGEAQVAAEMLEAAQRIGFFYVRNHGIPQPLIDDVFALGRRFFAQPQAEKDRIAVNPWHRGFIRVGEAKMFAGARPDLKESFIWGLHADDAATGPNAHGTPPNQWPAGLPDMQPTLTRYFEETNAVGWRLLRAFATGLGAPADTFVQTITRPTTRGALVWYPPQAAEDTPEAGTQQYGVSPHTDWGCLTLLYQDMSGGLEVQGSDGGWVQATPIPGTYVVNVGDLLARWTNDRFRSTPHRVVNRSGRERLSCAVFVDPDRDTLIAPVTTDGAAPRYEPVTCGAYVQGRFDAAFAYRQKATT